MLDLIIHLLVYLGAAVMILGIAGFIRYARFAKRRTAWESGNAILYVPIVLLVLFLIGYLVVGIFGKPDLVMAGILFGGSIFVFIMYKLLFSITRRVMDYESMQSQLLATQEAERVKTGFMATISHEMRTPLNVILGLDQLALTRKDLPEETRGQLTKIGLSATHLLGLINNVLDMNRIESGELTVRPENFHLADALDQVEAIARTCCEEKGLTFEAVCEEEAEGYYLGDEMMLKQVLLGILDNAVKYTEAPGTVRLEVKSGIGQGGAKALTFVITDTGIGMDEDFLPKVFEAFEQEDSGFTTRYGGSGLSMAVTKKMVELMGGIVSVQSEKNKGSKFFVTIPLKAAIEQDASPVGSLEGLRILIVEDIPENMEIVADLLELEGAKNEHAENGQIGLEMFKHNPPGYYDAILMDLRMPVMDGLEASRRIRQLPREDAATIPIIALTANAFDSDVQKAREAGMNEHLAKPTDADQLYAAILACVKKPDTVVDEQK